MNFAGYDCFLLVILCLPDYIACFIDQDELVPADFNSKLSQ